MITLTDNAVEKLSTLITGNKQLRVLVKGTGCSGMAYHLEYNLMETDQDDSFTVRGIPVVIDKKSQVYVEGAEIDLSLIHISEHTRQEAITYAVFC